MSDLENLRRMLRNAGVKYTEESIDFEIYLCTDSEATYGGLFVCFVFRTDGTLRWVGSLAEPPESEQKKKSRSDKNQTLEDGDDILRQLGNNNTMI
jgi:hypothetical protein